MNLCFALLVFNAGFVAGVYWATWRASRSREQSAASSLYNDA